MCSLALCAQTLFSFLHAGALGTRVFEFSQPARHACILSTLSLTWRL
jgi:hypothetical protein